MIIIGFGFLAGGGPGAFNLVGSVVEAALGGAAVAAIATAGPLAFGGGGGGAYFGMFGLPSGPWSSAATSYEG